MPDFIPGLQGIPAAVSAISFVDGENGLLSYRGIPIQALAERSTFEEVAYLLLFGELPSASELDAFRKRLVAARPLPGSLVNTIETFPKTAHPMTVLQTAVSALAMFSPSADFADAGAREATAIEIIAKVPTIVGLFERHRAGLELTQGDGSLSHAGNFLFLVTGRAPDPLIEHIMDVCLILHADHTMNASTFTARVASSTLAGPYSAVSAAIGSLSGPLHGGANERVLAQLHQIGAGEQVRDHVKRMIQDKVRIMGLGHRVYKTKDPRAVILQALAEELFARDGKSDLYDIAVELEAVTKETLGARGIYPNVDFYSGVVYDKLGIPTDLFTPIFAVSRSAGWLAHWLEQMTDNKLYRPRQVYAGRHDVPYTDMADR